MTALRAGSATDVGRVRSNNQDQLLVATPLFAVADGMGGHAAGEVASLVAVETLKAASGSELTAEALIAAVEQANRAVWDRAQKDPALRGMGTTLSAIALVREAGEDEVAVANVGDSRVYLLRDGELSQITTDHTLVQELVTDGQLSEAEADVHPQRHVLTRALGIDPDVDVDLITVAPFRGDRFLLCSDGLPREVTDRQVASILRRLRDPGEAARELVAEARARGGNDNITAVVVDVVDDDDRAVVASAALAGDPTRTSEFEAIREPSSQERAGKTATPVRARPVEAGPTAHVLTVRVVLFFVLVLLLVGGAAAAIGYYARGTYFVGLQGNALTIYKGRPGGVLWLKPTVADRTGVALADVLPNHADDLKAGRQEPTLAKAREYVRNLQAEAAAHGVGPGAVAAPPPGAPTATTIAPAPQTVAP